MTKFIIFAVILSQIAVNSFAQENSQKSLPKEKSPIKIALTGETTLVEHAQVRAKPDEKGVLTFVAENDKFTGTDRGYTNGMRLSYTTSEEVMPKLIRKVASYLPMLAKDGKKRVNIAAGHSMFTPNDVYSKQLIPDDRPYASWLYGSLGLISDTDKTLDVAVLTLGVVGPSAQGKNAQNEVHKAMNVDESYGWRNQLKDEPGINFTYERKWRSIFESSPFGLGFDVIPHLGASLGNVDTSASTGVTLRLGRDLPADYGPPRIRPSLPGSDFFHPSGKINGYIYTTIETRAVLRNIFLDGNSFQGGPHVRKKTSVSSLEIGASVIYKDMRVSFANVFLTKEFEGEQGNVKFGVLTVSYRF